MKEKYTIYLGLLAIDLLTGWATVFGPMTHPDTVPYTLGAVIFINVLVLVNVLFIDQIVGSLIRADMEDWKKGKYWTPFGLRDISSGEADK